MDAVLEKPRTRTAALGKLVGAQIRKFRKHRGMTLQELAAAIGTTPQTVQRMEAAKMEVALKWIERICAALDIQPYELFNTEALNELVDARITAEARLHTLQQGFALFCNTVKSTYAKELQP